MYNMNSRQIYIAYRKARRKFSLRTYVLLMLWLVLALSQWLIVCLVPAIRDVFRKHYYISIATFMLAISLFLIFLFLEKLRYLRVVSPLISFLIVELQIIALFTLVSRTYWAEMIMYFAICAVLITLFVIIGVFLPRKMDLTLHIALIFILAFMFLLVAVFFLLHQLLVAEVWRDIHDYGFLLVQIPITLTMLFFVMYHAQTINGGRFAEMRLHDYCLGSLILFHDFLIIYWLTFYWQLIAGAVTPNNWPLLTTLWDRNDKKPTEIDYDEKHEEIGKKITQATTADQSDLSITQDFNEDKETITVNDKTSLAPKKRYRFAKRLDKRITIERPSRNFYNDDEY